jgi:hypothetical protein
MAIDLDRKPAHHDFIYPAADTLPVALREKFGYMLAGRQTNGTPYLVPEADYIPAVLRVSP